MKRFLGGSAGRSDAVVAGGLVSAVATVPYSPADSPQRNEHIITNDRCCLLRHMPLNMLTIGSGIIESRNNFMQADMKIKSQ